MFGGQGMETRMPGKIDPHYLRKLIFSTSGMACLYFDFKATIIHPTSFDQPNCPEVQIIERKLSCAKRANFKDSYTVLQNISNYL